MAFTSNKLLLNIMAVGLFLSSPLLAADWKGFTAQKNGFQASFPTQPEHVEQKIPIPRTDLAIYYNTFISEPSEDVVYVISVWNYPAEIDMSNPEGNLQDGFGGMLSALPGSQVVSMQMGEQQGFKSLSFLVKNEDIYFQGKLILVYNTLYQVFAVYKAKDTLDTNYSRFIESFELINPELQKVEKKATPSNTLSV
ncbi:MAG: hypothetical protein S4CHLAM81_04290 [Chlamydiales bacterium]|nr:hypothetical protein [Chlamydiales bacterium]MCH9635218.1 hypothetical protein [Chlamydiales bacterium]MCH9704378.1 hypothetical protein [Chlamydiota bacterium]